jgi:GNAT superfamily N-acetyltransferase
MDNQVRPAKRMVEVQITSEQREAQKAEARARVESRIRDNTDAQTADAIIALRRNKQKLPIALRAVAQEDVSFIFSSWLKSFRHSLSVKNVAQPIYYSEQHKLIERLFSTSQVLVAANPNDISQIYGYIFYDQYDGIYTCHYVYVKEVFRNLGVAEQLMRESGYRKVAGGMYTHETPVAFREAPNYNLVYHPYLLLNYKLTPSEKVAIKLKE